MNAAKKASRKSATKLESRQSAIKFNSRIELPGSYKKLPAGKNLGSASLNEVIEVMIKIKRKTPIRAFVKGLASGSK